MHKMREAIKLRKKDPMKNVIHVDEFVAGDEEKGKVGRSYDSKKKKVGCAVELTETDKIKRMYPLKINNFSSKELSGILENHIDKKARITTDLWKGYHPLYEDYTITQIESGNGLSVTASHIIIHQIKSWIRTSYF